MWQPVICIMNESNLTKTKYPAEQLAKLDNIIPQLQAANLICIQWGNNTLPSL